MNILKPIWLVFLLSSQVVFAQQDKGALLYGNSLSNADSLSNWVMEGPGITSTENGWMRMFSPEQAGHHVYWCPQQFPADFVAEWELKNNNPKAGLVIIFFAAKGSDGEPVLSEKLKARNGTFKQYTKGDIRNYHISYYANTTQQKDRPFAHLRKNPGFNKVHIGKAGIPANSTAIHRVQLSKKNGRIQLLVDNELVIDWQDDGKAFGPVLDGGHIGFRQMKWTDFSYRNFQVWKVD